MAETHSIVTEVTYNELVALINLSELEPGLTYQLTDYKTVYYMAGGNSMMGFSHLTEEGSPIIQEGETEQLLLLATSANTLDKRAKSISHPNDIIHYDWNPGNWLDNLNFSVDGENIVAGFKGVIHFRRDTLLNNQTNHDYRNVVNRMFNITQPTWEAGGYNEGDYVTYAGVIYYATTAITDEVPGFGGEWLALIDISENAYISFDPTMFLLGGGLGPMDGAFIIPILDDTDYEEKKWLGDGCNNCEIPEYILKEIGTKSENMLTPLIVFGNDCRAISFGNNCSVISFGNSCELISFRNFCSGISFGNGCSGISFGNGCELISFGSYCGSISFGSACGLISFRNSCWSISFRNFCWVISFGSACSGISFGNGCELISFGSYCGTISFGNKIQLVDAISLGLYLTGGGSKDFRLNADGDVLMLQYDGSNTLQVTNLSDI